MTDAAAVKFLNLIAVFGIHNYISGAVLKHKKILAKTAQLPISVISTTNPYYLIIRITPMRVIPSIGRRSVRIADIPIREINNKIEVVLSRRFNSRNIPRPGVEDLFEI